MRRRSARCGVRDNEVNAMTDETMGTVLQNCPVCGAPVAADATACEACGFKLLGRTQAFKPLNMQAQASPAMANPALLSEATLKIVKARNWQLIPPGGRSSYRGPQSAVRHLPKRHDGFAHACDYRAHAGRLPH